MVVLEKGRSREGSAFSFFRQRSRRRSVDWPDTLNGIVCLIRSAESGSFAAAGRALGLTPAAVGKNVARLEAAPVPAQHARYYPAQKLLPRKTRVFVEHVMASFERDDLAARISAQHPEVL